MQLAQLNIGEFRHPVDDPRMQGFTGRVDAVNALADRAEGFIWRLVDDNDEVDGALDLRLPGGGDLAVNLSVWRDLDSLWRFVFKTAHAKVMRNRTDYFLPHKAAYLVLWWIEDGARPTLAEAKAKLDRLNEIGPSAEAFTFDTAFDADGRLMRLQWPEKDCA